MSRDQSGLADDPAVHAEKNEMRFFSDGSPLRGKPPRMGNVISILACNPIRVALSEPLVEAGGLAGVSRIADQADPRVARGVGFQDGDGPIRGSIVHDHELEVRKALREDALDRFR